MNYRRLPKNLYVLAIAQALCMAVSPFNTLVGGIVGFRLAPTPALATLPVALMIVGLAASTIPAALIMRRSGRRAGFMLGAAVASAAALLAAIAVSREWFAVFCLATFLMGSNLAFVQQYRFAAAESVAPSHIGKAVSFVLLGTLLAAFLGPELANRATPALGLGHYPVAYLMLAAVLGIAMLVLWRYQDAPRSAEPAIGARPPLREIWRQPGYLLAVAAAATGYGVMTFLMTATPISMHVKDGHSLGHTAFVIQSHIAAMYLPSLFSGWLIARFGERRLLLAGVGFFLACLLVASHGRGLAQYWFALVFLGIGWNFLFVSGTTLLARLTRGPERFRAQAANDFTVFSITALASLFSGAAVHAWGWDVMLWLALAPLLILVLLVLSPRFTPADPSA